MQLEAGTVILLPYPHTDLKPGKRRPALVLTPSEYNERSSDAIVAYVTSQPQTSPWSLPMTNQDLESGSLVRKSWVRVDRLATLDQHLIQKTVARLNRTHLRQVRTRLHELLVEPAADATFS